MENTWLFPLLEAVHVVGLGMLVGAIVLGDLTVLGWIDGRTPQLARWTHTGLAIALTTGILLFFADRGRYVGNPAFLVKMALLVAALTVHFTIRRKATRLAAAGSLVLWTLVVLAARAIIDFDV